MLLALRIDGVLLRDAVSLIPTYSFLGSFSPKNFMYNFGVLPKKNEGIFLLCLGTKAPHDPVIDTFTIHCICNLTLLLFSVYLFIMTENKFKRIR